MAKTFKLKIITLDKIVVDKEIEKLFTKTAYGEIEFLPGYAESIISTIPCITKICDENGSIEEVFTSKGIINIKNNELTFLCDAAEYPEEIDFERAEKAKERAENRLLEKEKYDVKRAEAALQRAIVRLSLKK